MLASLQLWSDIIPFEPSCKVGTVNRSLLDEQIEVSWWLSQEQYLVPCILRAQSFSTYTAQARLMQNMKSEKVAGPPTQPEDIS